MSANNGLLNIISWNAQSIANGAKLAQFERLLNERNIHVACLQETYLNRDSKFYLPNYTIYRNDRLTHGGGVAIAIKRGIQHDLLDLCVTMNMECIAIAIHLRSGTINISSVYSPHYSIHFGSDLSKITATNNECMIFGDFNAKHPSWHCSMANRSGNILFNHLNTSDFMLHAPSAHTQYTLPARRHVPFNHRFTPIQFHNTNKRILHTGGPPHIGSLPNLLPNQRRFYNDTQNHIYLFQSKLASVSTHHRRTTFRRYM